MSVSETRKNQFSQLNEQAAMLSANLVEFDSLVKNLCTQYDSIQQLGIMHGALFMASHQVFGNNYNGASEDDRNGPT